MAITKRQIELEVRANNLSNKSMDEVIRNISELSEALEVQAKLAEQGQGSVDDLAKTYDKLTKAGNALVSQSGVVEQMGLLAQSVEKARDRVADTTKTLDDYKTSIAGFAKLTGEQSSQLARLEKAAKSAGTALEAQNKKFAKVTANAERIGVNMDNLAQANDRVAESSKRLNTIQSKVSDNLDNYAEKISEAAEAAAKLKAQGDIDLKITETRKVAEYARMFDEIAASEAKVAKEAAEVNRQYDEMISKETELANRKRQAAQDAVRGRAESDAALVDKVRQADYARMFDELAAKEAEAARQAEVLAKETADLERELKALGTTLEKASKGQLAFAKAAAKSAKDADGAAKSSNTLLGSMGQLQKSLIGGERTSLGFFQRMRGEILSLIAVYVGFQGAIDTARGALQAFRNEQATQVKLLVATGNNVGAAAEEYSYLRAQAERLGVAFADLSSGYASFRIAAKDANLSLQDTRFIFESISEAGVKLNLTQENIAGIQKALEQLVSKGVASTEELGQQLGDRLPGVMQVAAKQMGFIGEDGVARFRKALENGQVDAVKAAAALARGMNAQFENIDMSKSLVGTEGRFQTALADWKLAIANSGLVEAYSDLLKKITEVMKSAEGKELAATIGKSFGAIAKVINYLIDNLATVKVVLSELTLMFGAFAVIRFVAGIRSAVSALTALVSTIRIGVIPAVVALNIALGALLLIPIGVWAYDNFEMIRKVVDTSAMGYRFIWEYIKVGFRTIGSVIALTFDFLTAGIRAALGVTISLMAKAARLAGKGGLAGELEKTAEIIRNGAAGGTFIGKLNEDIGIARRNIRLLQNDIDVTERLKKKALVYDEKSGLYLKQSFIDASKQGTKTQETGKIDTALTGSKDKAKQEAEQYANTLESLIDRVAAVTAQAQKKDKENLATHLEGIRKQYEGLFKDIGKLNAKDAAVLRKNLQDAVDSLSDQVKEDYWQKQADGLDAIKKKFAEMDVQLGKGGGEAGRAQIVAGIAEQFKQIRDEIEKLDLEKLGGVQRKMELLSSLGANEAATRERALNADRFREAQENSKALENLVEQRTQKIEELQTRVNRGQLTESAMFTETARIVSESQPAIDAAAQSALQFAEALRGAVGVDQAALEAYILKLQKITTSYQDIRTEMYSTADANKDLADIGAGTMDSLAKNIAEVGMGFASWSDGIRAFGLDFAKMAADYLRKLAMMIIQQQILNALQGTGIGGSIAGAMKGLLNHTGGVVGSTGMNRTVSSSWFANAPRYHTGGIAGLAPNEYPSILKKNEEVLTENDPRNVLNGGLSRGGQSAPVVQDVKVMNMIDSGSFVSEGMSTPQGVKAVLNFITANRTQVKSILG